MDNAFTRSLRFGRASMRCSACLECSKYVVWWRLEVDTRVEDPFQKHALCPSCAQGVEVLLRLSDDREGFENALNAFYVAKRSSSGYNGGKL